MTEEAFRITKHIPAGSIVVDSVIALSLMFSWGQTTETLRSLDQRMQRIEAAQLQPDRAVDARLQFLSDENKRQDDSARAMKDEILARLSRIESKLDRIR